MLLGSVSGGVIAQMTTLGVPFVLRTLLLLVTFAVAWVLMRDLGFTPVRGPGPGRQVRRILRTSVQFGLGQPSVRWVMLTSPLIGGVGVYVFYAMQPYLLELYGDPGAYAVAGLAAAIVAGAQIVGGLLAARLRRLFHRRTSLLLVSSAIGAGALLLAGVVPAFGVVIGMLVLGGLADAAAQPVRQAYLNALIPGEQRATVLSFDSLLASSGGVVVQPALGRIADVAGYAPTFVLSAIIRSAAVPLLLLARRTGSPADLAGTDPTEPG
jgi:MFS family permease